MTIKSKKRNCCPPGHFTLFLNESHKYEEIKSIVETVFNHINSITVGEFEAYEAIEKLKHAQIRLNHINANNKAVNDVWKFKGGNKAKAIINKVISNNKVMTFDNIEEYVNKCGAKPVINESKKHITDEREIKINGQYIDCFQTKELVNIKRTLTEKKKLAYQAIKNASLNEKSRVSSSYGKICRALAQINEELAERKLYEDDEDIEAETVDQDKVDKAFGNKTDKNTDKSDKQSDSSTPDNDDEGEVVDLARIEIKLVSTEAANELAQACVDAGIPETAYEIEGADVEDEEGDNDDNSKDDSADGEESKQTDEETEKKETETSEALLMKAIRRSLYEDEDAAEPAPAPDPEPAPSPAPSAGPVDFPDTGDAEPAETEDTDSEDKVVKFILLDTNYALKLADVLDKEYGITRAEFEEMIGGELLDEEGDDAESDDETKDDSSNDTDKKDTTEDEKDDISPSNLFKGL